MRYSDEIISFDVPTKFSKGKVKVIAPDSWQIECKGTLFSIGVPRGLKFLTTREIYEECMKIEQRNLQTVNQITDIQNPLIKEGFYAYNHRITPNQKIHYYLSGSLLCENIVVSIYSVGLIKLSETVSIEDFMPPINSISFNVEAYNKSVKEFEKKMEKTFKNAEKIYKNAMGVCSCPETLNNDD